MNESYLPFSREREKGLGDEGATRATPRLTRSQNPFHQPPSSRLYPETIGFADPIPAGTALASG